LNENNGIYLNKSNTLVPTHWICLATMLDDTGICWTKIIFHHPTLVFSDTVWTTKIDSFDWPIQQCLTLAPVNGKILPNTVNEVAKQTQHFFRNNVRGSCIQHPIMVISTMFKATGFFWQAALMSMEKVFLWTSQFYKIRNSWTASGLFSHFHIADFRTRCSSLKASM